MLGRTLRRNDGDVGIAILDRLSRKVLHERTVLHQVLGNGNRLGRRKSHNGRHRLEPARTNLLNGVDEIGVCESDAFVTLLELEEEVIVLDDLAELRSRKPLTVFPKRHRTVHTSEHRRLASRRLRKPFHPKTGINRFRMSFDETPKRRTDLLVQGIVLRRRPQTDTVNE